MTTSNRRILIIDDSEAIHGDFEKILLRLGADQELDSLEADIFGVEPSGNLQASFLLEHAYQGQEGFTRVLESVQNNQPYAMAFVDMRMPPGWDGLETIAHLWAADPRLHIVICTAYSDYSWNEVIQRLGQNDRWLVLKKPFDPAEVTQLAAALVEKRRLSDQLLARMHTLETEVADYATTLDERERRLDAILSTAPDGIIVFSQDGNIVSFNPAAVALFHMSVDQAVGRPVDSLYMTDNEPSSSECIAFPTLQVDQTDWSTMMDVICIRADGSRFPSHWSVRSFEFNQKRYFTAIVRDETDRERLRAELSQAQKLEAIGQLAAGIAHEINTPTQFVSDNIRFLRDSFEDLQRVASAFKCLVEKDGCSKGPLDQARTILQEVDTEYLASEIPTTINQTLAGLDRISTIVRAMKEFSHPGTQEKLPADIHAAIRSTVTVAQNEWKYVAEVDMDFDETVTEIPCLLGELNQVLINLIVNAAHAISDKLGSQFHSKGHIRISTKRTDDGVEIRIADTGSGIPEHIRHRVFEPFYTTKGVGKGTGQGLAIARSVIVDKHNGQLTFDSSPDGTTFLIRLPVLSAAAVEEGLHYACR